jgi:putative membrane protein|uniref:Carotenoid biosynthesis protein n=1 Tax=Desulfobacca acetoxidans TaxID=60893 RepID=A0A7C3Z9K5_9BACT
MHFLSLLWGTILLRPYVFIFLTCYLALATWQFGGGRTLAFLAAGYLVAWMAEFCSIHTGFPFGVYFYIPATTDRELWVAGVPFMDSLSYVFLAYASYSMALLALCPNRWQGRRFFLDDSRLRFSWRTTILGGVLMMTLDVVTDPVALRGYRWFLGQIYGYPEAGAYFGIPLANFAGWLLVSVILVRVLQFLVSHLPSRPFWDLGRREFPGRALLGPGLYLGILAFNLALTLWIDEPNIFWAGVFISLPFLTWLALKVWPDRGLGSA